MGEEKMKMQKVRIYLTPAEVQIEDSGGKGKASHTSNFKLYTQLELMQI